ncbi:MAG: radical SAM protein [Rickettsiales bacterium]|nr:radical SAM protein [Rickettsiales bacterium]
MTENAIKYGNRRFTFREVDAFIRWFETGNHPTVFGRLDEAYNRLITVIRHGQSEDIFDWHLYNADDMILKGSGGRSIFDVHLDAGAEGYLALRQGVRFYITMMAEMYAKSDAETRARFEQLPVKDDDKWYQADILVLGELYMALARGDDAKAAVRRAFENISNENAVENIVETAEKSGARVKFGDFMELDSDGYPYALRVVEAHAHISPFMMDLGLASRWLASGKNMATWQSTPDPIFDPDNPGGLGKYKYIHADKLPSAGLAPLPRLAALEVAPGPYAVMRMIYGIGCNLKCKYCSTYCGEDSGNRKKFLTMAERLISAKIFHNLGLKTLIVNGKGEPLMQPDVPKFTTLLRKTMNINTVIATNGTLLNERLLGQLNDATATLVLKLNSMDAKKNDEIVGVSGAHEKFMTAIDGAIRHGFAAGRRLAIDCCITKDTVSEMGNIMRFCLERNIILWADEAIPIGRQEQDDCVSFRKLAETHFEMAAAARDFGYKLDVGDGHFLAGEPWINFNFIQLTNRGKALLVPRFGEKKQIDRYPFAKLAQKQL